MAHDLAEAYADLNEMYADLFESMGMEPPSRADFDALMGPLLRQAKTEGSPADTAQLSTASSFDDDADLVIGRGLAANQAFTDELSRELRRRLEAGKGEALPQAN